jgi:hypothetical protein
LIAAPGPSAGDGPGVPSSTVTGFGEGTAHYCVSGYAPNAAVALHNERTGDDTSIRTNNRGTGCTDVKVEVECGRLVVQSVVAVGLAADGNPGTSSARAMVPGNVAPCDPSDGSVAASKGTSSLSGTVKAIIAGAGVGGLVLITIAVIMVRRRRSAAAG